MASTARIFRLAEDAESKLQMVASRTTLLFVITTMRRTI